MHSGLVYAHFRKFKTAFRFCEKSLYPQFILLLNHSAANLKISTSISTVYITWKWCNIFFNDYDLQSLSYLEANISAFLSSLFNSLTTKEHFVNFVVGPNNLSLIFFKWKGGCIYPLLSRVNAYERAYETAGIVNVLKVLHFRS